MNRLYEYLDGVQDGSIITGRLIKRAVERHIKDLQRTDIEFRVNEAQKCIDFIEHTLVHGQDICAGKPFILEPWQVFAVASIHGWFYKESGKRRFTSSYLQIARKNGKTALACALALMNLILESERGSEVILTANSMGQAKDVSFKAILSFVNQLDPHYKILKPYYQEIKVKQSKYPSYLKVLASDVKNMAGRNTSFAIVDEFFGALNHGLREMIRTSMVMRENPHLMTISSAGFDTTSPCYSLRNSCVDILDGVSVDDTMFALIYEMDEEDVWYDEKNWAKSNPNLGVTVRLDTLKDFVERAKQNPSIEVEIKTLNLNIWCTTATTWIPDEKLAPCFQNLDINDFTGSAAGTVEAYIGIDLAKTRDFTCWVLMIPKDDKFYFFPQFYLPEDSIHTQIDVSRYLSYVNQKLIKLTPQDTCDYDVIRNDIMDLSKKFYITDIAYDAWNASQFAIECGKEGIPMRAFSQSYGNFSDPTGELERMVMKGTAVFQNNQILRDNFRNTRIEYYQGNMKPARTNNQSRKIDGVISAIMAFGAYQRSGPQLYQGGMY